MSPSSRQVPVDSNTAFRNILSARCVFEVRLRLNLPIGGDCEEFNTENRH
ncbi:hypothetical protein Plim_1461 [Planctopirus limnophila DSM 3776]|uniref:Uncharacterized protein n=1 Tax=Planctopirus limnophila (strain ATCC 43296 / DSM 3776 / IFAM 1008 / Mu 290) TaxID=521674 RepID=D5SW10_PLAL2|nr:hypothetical protein Plim_1461 [Planctopirus limnophila DSM 3776]